jgi:hypothetical protein
MARSKPSTRRDFLKLGAGAVSLAALAPRFGFAGAASASTPIRLSAGPQLFVDDYLIADQKNLGRVINAPPVRLDHPIVTSTEDGAYQPYISVVRDPQSKRFRLWYGVPAKPGGSHIAYLESENGIDWIRPHRVLEDASSIDYGNSVIDEGPAFANRSARYKMAWDKNGVCTAVSADGLKWISTGPQPVIAKTGDIVSLSRDPYRNRYLLIVKLGAKPEDGYKGSTPNAKEGHRRLVGQSVSDDFVRWSAPKRIIVPDEKDEGVTEFYSIGNVIARGGLLIGLLKVLRDDLPAEPGGKVEGIGYTVLAWSRDSEHWERDRTPFMDRNPQPGTWDRAMTWGDCLLPVGDEVFIYYGGYARGHKVERYKERQIGFARMQRDRFVSRDAGSNGGSLRTPTIVVEREKLTVNANVKGELRVRLLDENGAALIGFDAGDCAPVRGDSLAHPIQWKGGQSLKALQGKSVRLEFLLQDARLYGFEFSS